MKLRNLNIICLLLIVQVAQSQTAWIEPDPKTAAFSPTKEATIYVDISKTECPDLANLTDLYMWTWSPNELPVGNEKNNGTWDASNEILKFTNEGGGIFSYTMIPTEFYEVSASEVYEKDFSFLAKGINGSGGLTSCNEDKTEDLKVEAEPFVLAKKVFSFPESTLNDSLFISSADYFTLIYDKQQEEKENLKLSDNFYVFLKAIGTDNKTYTFASPNQLDNTPSLKMREGESDKYYWTVSPVKFLSNLIPANVGIQTLRIQIAKEGAKSAGDLSDGIYDFHYICR